MRATALVLTACFALPACLGDADTGASTAPIIGGAAAPGDAAVMMIASYPPDRSVLTTCSAALIAPTVLVTAAHCVDHPGELFGVFPGADAAPYPTLAALEPHLSAVAEVHMHPSYSRSAPFRADIGVVVLAAPAAATPLAIRRAPVTAADVGAPARIVGYGQAQVGVFSSTRRAATTVVAGLDPDDTVRVGDPQHRTCIGDSGGPALITEGGAEVVLGVDSYADNAACDRAAHFRRVDLYLSFLDAYTGGAPVGPDAGVEPPDDDEGSGGCSTGGGTSGGAVLLLALCLVRYTRAATGHRAHRRGVR